MRERKGKKKARTILIQQQHRIEASREREELPTAEIEETERDGACALSLKYK